MTNLPAEVAVMAEQVTGRGLRGVVCAAAPIAAQTAAQAMRDGGNAFDAAVTAALAETVLLPPKCGLGGDLVAIVLHAGASEPEALIAVGGAPAGLADVAASGNWRKVGPNSVGPPGAAAGYSALADHGRFDRSRLARPAIELAVGGFAWATVCTRLSEQAVALVAEMHPEGCTYYPGGLPIVAGSAVRLPRLADALAEWAERGSQFLDGPVGEAILRAVCARGGVLSRDDLGSARAEWMPSARSVVGGRSIWVTPAPTHGPSLLDALAGVPAEAMRSAGGAAAAALHSSVMRAIAGRRDMLADPGGTSMVSAADSDGNVVVIIHSNSFPRFGSGIVVPEYDLPLANRAGRGFSPEPGHPNFPVAGRRPATTLHAWVVSDLEGHPSLFGGTPGGANQMPWNAQTVARIVGGEERPGVLVAAPVWEWLPDDDGLRLEVGFDVETEAALVAAPAVTGARIVHAPRWGCKSAQQVVRVPPADGPRKGVWEGAADPRTVGMALGL
ncbi:MAG: hypothetical protein FD127_2470 [Acidimicrobiaceae bacterium]|nr:MAG: hypothetical protein FD127_2470 [Acidimicrobiaceae bacterium]